MFLLPRSSSAGLENRSSRSLSSSRGQRLNQFNLLSLSAPAVTKSSGHFLYKGQMSGALFLFSVPERHLMAAVWPAHQLPLTSGCLFTPPPPACKSEQQCFRFKDKASKGEAIEVLTVLRCFMNFWAEQKELISTSNSTFFFLTFFYCYYCFLLANVCMLYQ